jgi:hypothetical protein
VTMISADNASCSNTSSSITRGGGGEVPVTEKTSNDSVKMNARGYFSGGFRELPPLCQQQQLVKMNFR